jgi:hypothetical protein
MIVTIIKIKNSVGLLQRRVACSYRKEIWREEKRDGRMKEKGRFNDINIPGDGNRL